MDVILTKELKLSFLEDLTKTGGTLETAKIHLFSNDIVPTDKTKLTDLTEAVYTGYAAQAVGKWGKPFLGEDNQPRVACPSLQFQPTGDVATETVRGYYITDTAGTTLYGAALLDQPEAMASALDAIIVQPVLRV